MLSGDNQQVLERPETAYRLAFILNLLGGQDDAWKEVVAVEAAVDTRVGAGVGDIQGDVKRYGLAEPFQCQLTAHPRHRLQIWSRRRGNQRHEVIDSRMLPR